MSDADVNLSRTNGEPAASSVSPTAGALLRAAREAAGLHVAALAVAMKVPVKKLEALEADRFDQMPDAVFVRALASGVCRALKIDATPILEKLPRSAIPRLDNEERGINTPFTVHGQGRRLAMPDLLGKPSVIAVVVLVLAAVAVVLFPDSVSVGGRTEPERVVTAVEPAAAVVDPVNIQPASAPALPVAEAQPVQLAVSAPMVAASASQPVVVSKPEPMVSAPEVSGPGSGLVAFKARGTSWVEVTDSKGVVQLRKTLQSGEKVYAPGMPPFAVVIGRADVTDVEVRGKSFPLDTIAKDNVARFEVK
jgi:cytoskeleton protein RodZ